MAEDLIRQLIDETNALPKHSLPTGFDLYRQNPGRMGFGYQQKSPERYDQDMRRAHFLERLKEADRTEYARVAGDDLESLRSPYQPLSADHPLVNAGRWFSSLPGAVYATGQMLANKVDPEANPYPNAADDYAKNMNNFLFFLDEPFGKNKNQMRDMQDMRTAQDAVPWDALGAPRDVIDQIVEGPYAAKATPKSGSEFLSETHLAGPERQVLEPYTKPAAVLGGAFMDATIDPLFGATTLPGLALEYGIGAAHGTVPTAIEGIRALRDYVNPPWNEQR